ncbi:hypothetical protein QYE76_049948 [Lolium multiflorum]|uniref:Uncharacterized protein n=1 Tax=Lolium multiflorum TaxID=4521 RepID=A0AAD8SQ17_LOLMU|nr:hypothetical protein QYE76_049948 [Lolium multiflorum]
MPSVILNGSSPWLRRSPYNIFSSGTSEDHKVQSYRNFTYSNQLQGGTYFKVGHLNHPVVKCNIPDASHFGGEDQNMYDRFKEDVEEAMNDGALSQIWTKAARQDHDAHVEIIADEPGGSNGDSGGFDDEDAMPLLVYVSREKRPAWPHHFKAGALNALLRVSSLVSNAPYVLVLDCDMYCNTRSSILEAMCFHLDSRGRHADDLAFVQFPQMFHNLSGSDIYANELRSIFSTRWKGLDGLRGPILSGTGFCVKRDAVYGAQPASSQDQFSSMEVGELKARFGHSNGHVASLRRSWSTIARDVLPEDATFLASCAYETGTKWGEEVGFLYQSVVEDYFTGYRQLYCRGWTSVYCYPAPSRPAPFLGSVPTNLNDVLVQNKRWMSGMLAVGLSRHCPLASAISVSVPQSMGFAYYAFMALYAFPVLCYATVPQLCFFRGATSFHEASSLWFAAVFVSSSLQHLVEVSVAKRRLAVIDSAFLVWLSRPLSKTVVLCVRQPQGCLFLHRPKLEKNPKLDLVVLKPELEPLALPAWMRKYATPTDRRYHNDPEESAGYAADAVLES